MKDDDRRIEDQRFNAALGARLRALRTEYKISRDELARRADINPRFLVDVESGAKGISAQSLFKLAQALRVSADVLLFDGQRERLDVAGLSEDEKSALADLIAAMERSKKL